MKKNLLSLLLLSFLALSSAFAQSRKITGTVTGADDGLPLPGVSIKVQGSSIGTQTNTEGKFTLSVPANAKTLDVSFIGFETVRVALTAALDYSVKLVANSRQLTEVVVSDSYGTQSKKAYTGAAATVGGDNLNDKPFSTPLEALQGQVAGLDVSQFSGQPGANIQVRLRGVGSITLDSNPLYVVDGMMITSGDVSRLTVTSSVIAGINEDDIETITVLKDASATALYGARASNGVIVITTKKGKGGKTAVNFDTEIGKTVNEPLPAAGKPLSNADYSTLFLEGLTNAGVVGAAAQAPYITSYNLNTPGANWYDLVTKQGQQQQYNVSARGGNENTKIFASAGYFKQEASTIGSDLKRITGLLNIDQTISKSVTFSAGLNISNVYQDTPLDGGAFGSPVLSAYFLRPGENPYLADGTTLNTSRATNSDFPSVYNPLYLVQADKKTLSETRLLGNAQLKWNIWDQLKFTSYFSGDYLVLEEEQYNNPIMGDGRTVGGRAYDDYTRYFNYLSRNQLDYRYNISNDNDFYVEASIGYEAQKSDGYFISSNSQAYPATQPLLTSSVNASTPITGNSTISGFTDAAFYTRGGINYKNRYSLTGSYRYEGSSKFGVNQPYGNFYSVGFAWDVDEEAFFKKQSIFSSAKFRTSYGSVGNSNGLGNYSAQITAGYGFTYAGLPGQNFNTIGNTNLTWETSKPFDIGADFGVLNDRLSVSFDYYYKNTDRLILAYPTARTTGFSSITENVGAMLNRGEEISIKATPLKLKDFQWFTNFNIAFNKNTVTNLVSPSLGTYAQEVGSDIYTWYARAYAGVDPANGDALWYKDATKTTTTNNYNAASPIPEYQADPKLFGGWTNTFSYKGFSISGDLYYNFGNYVYDAWSFYLNDGTQYTFNKYAYELNRWTTPGQITDVPKYIDGGGTQANGATYSSSSSYSSRFLYKGDYIRLKNLTVGYDFKNLSGLKKLGISKLYLYGRGTNIWTKTFDSRLPFDPEVGINGQSNLEVPIVRTFTIGINLGL